MMNYFLTFLSLSHAIFNCKKTKGVLHYVPLTVFRIPSPFSRETKTYNRYKNIALHDRLYNEFVPDMFHIFIVDEYGIYKIFIVYNVCGCGVDDLWPFYQMYNSRWSTCWSVAQFKWECTVSIVSNEIKILDIYFFDHFLFTPPLVMRNMICVTSMTICLRNMYG